MYITTATPMSWILISQHLPVYPLISTAATAMVGIIRGIIRILTIAAGGTVHGITDGTIRGIMADGTAHGITVDGTVRGIMADGTAHGITADGIVHGITIRTIMADGMAEDIIITAIDIIATADKAIQQAVAVLCAPAIMLLGEVMPQALIQAAVLPQ